MTLPNKFTMARIFSAPLFFTLFYFFIYKNLFFNPGIFILFVFFGLAELTDLADGFIARKYNLVSDLGKLLDPFADVFCRFTYFLCFVMVDIMPVWAYVIVLWREITIMFIRTILIKEGTAMGARFSGKMKSLFYSVACICGFLFLIVGVFVSPELPSMLISVKVLWAIFAATALAALLSLLDYVFVFLKIIKK